ncbi:MAG TPA: hypothetical protein VNV66_13215, partial [Pilimelia sp.]|nr:hypothetical protein [Pilimelia sp.]
MSGTAASVGADPTGPGGTAQAAESAAPGRGSAPLGGAPLAVTAAAPQPPRAEPTGPGPELPLARAVGADTPPVRRLGLGEPMVPPVHPAAGSGPAREVGAFGSPPRGGRPAGPPDHPAAVQRSPASPQPTPSRPVGGATPLTLAAPGPAAPAPLTASPTAPQGPARPGDAGSESGAAAVGEPPDSTAAGAGSPPS